MAQADRSIRDLQWLGSHLLDRTLCYFFRDIVMEHFLGFRDVESPNGRFTTDRQMCFDLAVDILYPTSTTGANDQTGFYAASSADFGLPLKQYAVITAASTDRMPTINKIPKYASS